MLLLSGTLMLKLNGVCNQKTCRKHESERGWPVERKLDNFRALSIASMQEFKAMDQAI
jgi:hypothetical protein